MRACVTCGEDVTNGTDICSMCLQEDNQYTEGYEE